MPNVLGISFFYHDSAASLVSDGNVITAASEERFSRRKHTSEFPKHAIEYCLAAGNIRSINDIDAIVYYEKPVLKFFRVIETMVATWPKSLPTFVNRFPTFVSSKLNVRRTIEKNLPGFTGPILFSEHHMSHAASAFYCSPFKEAAILTIDGVGEWQTTTLGMGTPSGIQLDQAIHFPHSIGLLYSALTGYLGFKVNDGEWKVMGLAPYGEPAYVEAFSKLVETKGDGSFHLNMEYFSHHFSQKWIANNRQWTKLFGFPPRKTGEKITQQHEDLARSGQAVVETLILGLAREARRKTGCDNLVIAGGVGLNSVANWKIEKEGIFKNVWVQPAAGDDGGALGAALYVSAKLFQSGFKSEMKHAYLGPEFDQEETAGFLDGSSIPHEHLEDELLIEKVADLLCQGKVCGWSRGRMEFGPRALGARSILGLATNPEMKAIINRKIKYREYFRPFAPAIPLENVHEYFDVEKGTSLPFMLKVPQVRLEKRALIPAVTHEDGTGRVQTVTKESNPVFHALLKAIERRTGIPVLINTSFNVRGEPIVCTPGDAYSCFIRTGIDFLVLGNNLITEKPHQAISHSQESSDKLESGEIRKSSVQLGRLSFEPKEDVTKTVLRFYRELPFNYYSNSIDTARELMRSNRIKAYPTLDEHLTKLSGGSVLDVGCGAGWFANSCARYYNQSVTGIDINPTVLKQARSVALLIPRCEKVQFIETDVFQFSPVKTFNVVNSLGVLHHTKDCFGAIKRALNWVSPKGYLHLGLYHFYGRKPFLDHFQNLRQSGASDEVIFQEFKKMNPSIKDATHLLSWYRDQVIHPHETQHTFEETYQLLDSEKFELVSTSINHFKPIKQVKDLFVLEKGFRQVSEKALRKKRYFPGFFTVWARRRS